MVGQRRALVKSQASRKGWKVLGAAAGTAALFVYTPWFLGAAGLAATAYLAYDWLRHRGKWGMRF